MFNPVRASSADASREASAYYDVVGDVRDGLRLLVYAFFVRWAFHNTAASVTRNRAQIFALSS